MAYYFSCDKQKCHVSVSVDFFPAWSLNIYKLVCVVNMVGSNIPKYLKWNSTKRYQGKRESRPPNPYQEKSPSSLHNGRKEELCRSSQGYEPHDKIVMFAYFFCFCLFPCFSWKMNCNFLLFHLYPPEVAVSLCKSIWGKCSIHCFKNQV